MKVKYPQLLVSLFTSSFVDRMIHSKHGQHLNSVLEKTAFSSGIRRSSTVQQVLANVFQFLKKHYRCEYVFKAAIVNELLLSKHSLHDTVYLTEFRSHSSKADIVILNGTSSVYEIKSDVDTLARLASQVSSYQLMFDKVNVVCNEKNVQRIKTIVPDGIGLIMLDADLSTQTIRDAESSLQFLDPGVMFDSLRKPEYISIVREIIGKKPDFSGTTIHSECKKIFCQLTKAEAHQFFIKALKKRQLSAAQINMVNGIDKSIKSLLTERPYSEKECKSIEYGLTQKLCNL